MSNRTDPARPPSYCRGYTMTARWVVEDPVAVEVDGSTVPDPDTVRPLTTVLVRMPAYFAEHLAPVLAAWTTIGELISKLSYDESRMSRALQFAAGAGERA